jgi:hypothetical protein
VLLLTGRDLEQPLPPVGIAAEGVGVLGELMGMADLRRVVLGQDLAHVEPLPLGEPGEQSPPASERAHPALSIAT